MTAVAPQPSTAPSNGQHPVLLQAVKLVKRYGIRTVVDQVSFQVGRGEIVGLLGPNGAGKTTSFRITIGMIDANGGQVFFNGKEISHMPMFERAREGMGYLAQEPSVFQRLSVIENLLAILETRSHDPRLHTRKQRHQAAMELIHQFGLEKKINDAACTCSGGERRKLEIARALTTDPKLILLDEPFSGVDPIAVNELQRQIFELRDKKGIAMLITDHNAQQTLRTCNRAYVIAEGRVLCEGTPKELVKNPEVRAAYLGNTFDGHEFD